MDFDRNAFWQDHHQQRSTRSRLKANQMGERKTSKAKKRTLNPSPLSLSVISRCKTGDVGWDVLKLNPNLLFNHSNQGPALRQLNSWKLTIEDRVFQHFEILTISSNVFTNDSDDQNRSFFLNFGYFWFIFPSTKKEWLQIPKIYFARP